MKCKITSGNLKTIANDLNEKLRFNHISNITMINSHDFLFTFSMYRKGKLFVSLNHQSPFVSLVNDIVATGTIVGALNDTLRKMVKDGCIQEIHTINNDRILAIEYSKLDDLYEKRNRTLILELIPHRQNLIILQDGLVIFASHYAGLENSRPLIRGMKYQFLENKKSSTEENIDLEELAKEAEEYFLKSKQERNLEKYKSLITHIKTRIKSLNNKLGILDKAINQAHEDLSYQEVGTTLLAFSQEPEELKKYVEENHLDYDYSLSLGNNAEKYFKKYKKAKRTIEMDQLEIKKTEEEIANLQMILKQIPYLKDEDLAQVYQELFPKKYRPTAKKMPVSTFGVINIENNKIYYGKNAKQNDELTFKKAKKTHYFFHIKDSHGSHVILENDHPNNEMILTAAEVALLMSGQEDGEVQYTQIKNIKKGSFLGQALLTSYQSIVIKNIRESTKKLLING